jgi:hypothetical protein
VNLKKKKRKRIKTSGIAKTLMLSLVDQKTMKSRRELSPMMVGILTN